jgi:outer membrane protein TolC
MRSNFLPIFAALALAGCGTVDGMTPVANHVASAGLVPVSIRTEEQTLAARAATDLLLKRALSAENAVQVALLNNKELQAAYNALGIAEAVRLQASLPPNPTVSVERIARSGSAEIEARIVGSILSLVTLPARAEIAADRLAQAQLQAAEATLRIATEARRGWYEAVAARSLAGFLTEAQSSAQAATQLSTRLGEAGTMNKLDQARNQVFFAEITAQLAGARQRADKARERLIRTMGLWGNDTEFSLARSLPPLPAPHTLRAIETEAVARRLDLQIARIEVVALAKSQGLTEATRFINLLDATGIRTSEKDAEGHRENGRGYEVELQIPIFDLGEAKSRLARETYMQAVNRLIAKAVNVRSEAREAYRSYRATYDIARHYRNEVLPLRKIISDEMLLRYNAMQVDVFALLSEARQRIASTSAAIEAQREFFLAQTNLGTAVLGGGTAETAGGGGATAAAEPTAGH